MLFADHERRGFGNRFEKYRSLSRLIGFSGNPSPQTPAPDVAPTNAMYTDVQLVLGSGVMTLEDSGSFELSRPVSGRQAVRAADRLLHSFQQVQR